MTNKYRLFSVGALGTFMATLDGSIVNVALPSIASNLGASIDAVSWVVLSYSLTLISLMLVFGTWVQKRGYFFGYKFGYFLFLAGSLVCSFAGDLTFLIVGRVIQAMGTAMFAAIGPGMVTTVFPAEERGKGIGLMVMMVSAGFMVGPPLGGLMLGIFPWQSIFVINIPIGLVGLSMVYRYFGHLDSSQGERRGGLLSAALMSVSLVAAVFAVKMINVWDAGDIRQILLILFALLTFAGFIFVERNPKRAMIGFAILRNKQFTIALITQQLHFAGMSAIFIMIPFYLERVMGFEPFEVGGYLVVVPILMFISAPLAGKASDVIGYRFLTAGGMATLGLGLYLALSFGTSTEQWYIIASLAIVGMGVGSFSTPNSSAMMGSVTEEQRAVVSSILATNRNIGHSMGVGVGTAMFSFFQMRQVGLTDQAEIFLAGFHPVVIGSIAVVSLGVILCLFRPNRKTAS